MIFKKQNNSDSHFVHKTNQAFLVFEHFLAHKYVQIWGTWVVQLVNVSHPWFWLGSDRRVVR